MPILHWLTREHDTFAASRTPYRLLEEDRELSVGEAESGNLLIHGDNLEALKALLPFYAGQAKCVYIDPPFNTKQAFPDYDDNLEHSIWLGMMFPRIECLRELMSPEGSIFVHLDDNEVDYAKVVMDEIFQRKNFVSRITLKARSPSAFSTVNPGVFKASEYLLWYAKEKQNFRQRRVWVSREPDPAYNKFIPNVEQNYEEWKIEPLAPYLADVTRAVRSVAAMSNSIRSFIVKHASQIVRLAEIDDSGAGQDTVAAKRKSQKFPERIVRHERQSGFDDIYITRGKQILFYKKNIRNIDGEDTPARMLTNIWDDISWEGIASEGGVRFPRAKKPERLIRRCLELVTEPGDLVVDSFLGSGTTAAVAHKMGRRYIGIEMGAQMRSHASKRLTNVIAGETSGVSRLVGWEGGGGFRFYRLGPPVFDEEGRIRPDIRFPVLAAHVWFSETGRPWDGGAESPLLGLHDGHAYALLYNGVLGDRRAAGGNVLTRATLAAIRDEIAQSRPGLGGGGPPEYPLTVYGEQSRLTPATLARERIVFKQTPYDVRARV